MSRNAHGVDDGWWRGESLGVVGNFPSLIVEECDEVRKYYVPENNYIIVEILLFLIVPKYFIFGFKEWGTTKLWGRWQLVTTGICSSSLRFTPRIPPYY